MANFQKRIPFTEVDEATRTVKGIVTAQVRDYAGETMHYGKSKPHYEHWSESLQKLSDGQNMGNLRAMHGNVAAGKATAITFDDDGKFIRMAFKVVDDNEWKKVQERVYTGFSHGGSYGKQWQEDGHKYYEAVPTEVSLVDYPCCPVATFEYVKANGAIELRKTKTISEEIVELETRLKELQKAAAAEQALLTGETSMDQETKAALDGINAGLTKQAEALTGIAELLKTQKPAVAQEPPPPQTQATAAPLTAEQVAEMVSKSVTNAMKAAFTAPAQPQKPVATMTKAQETGATTTETVKDLTTEELRKLNEGEQNQYLAKRLIAQPITEAQADGILNLLRG